MSDELDNKHKSLYIFGRDVSDIPCFRDSFLYGICGGIGIGLLTFLGTSRTPLATHIGFGSFVCGTVGYWFQCRYTWSKRRFDQRILMEAIRNHAIHEGSQKERDLDLKNANNVNPEIQA